MDTGVWSTRQVNGLVRSEGRLREALQSLGEQLGTPEQTAAALECIPTRHREVAALYVGLVELQAHLAEQLARLAERSTQ